MTIFTRQFQYKQESKKIIILTKFIQHTQQQKCLSIHNIETLLGTPTTDPNFISINEISVDSIAF